MTDKIRLRICLVVLPVLMLAASPVRAERLLRWKFAPGQKLDLRTVQTMKLNLAVGEGGSLTLATDLTMEVSWAVESVADDGSARIAQKIDRLVLATDTFGPDGKVRVDTDAPEEEPNETAAELSKMLEPLIGVKFRQTVGPRGEVRDVEWPDDSADAATKEAAGGVGDLIGEEGMADVFRRTAVVLPERPIDVGHRWTESTALKDRNGTMRLERQFQYVGTEIQNGVPLERIAVVMTVRFDKDAQKAIEVIRQDNTGVIYFDSAAGRITQSELKQKMILKTTGAKRVVQQTIETTTKMRITSAARPKGELEPRR